MAESIISDLALRTRFSILNKKEITVTGIPDGKHVKYAREYHTLPGRSAA
jgi:hypothetical protein